MTRSRTILACAVLATATAAALPAAQATASTPHRATTTIQLNRSKASVTPGTHVGLAARFLANNHPRTNTPVVLNVHDANGRSSNLALKTSATGLVSILVAPTATSRYTFTIGATSTAAAATAATSIQVSSYPALMAVSTNPNPVTAGSAVQLHAVIAANRKAYSGAAVYLYGNGHLVGFHHTDGAGSVWFPAYPTVNTNYVLISPQNLPYRASSARVNVSVRYQPSYAVQASPAQVVLGQSSTIAGTVSRNGHPAAGLHATLHSSTSSATQVATTNANGQVSFTVTPTQSSDYTISTAALGDLLAGSSNPTTVTVTPAPPVTFPTTVAVAANPASIIAGASSTVTATVTANGGPRASALAVLTDNNGTQLDAATTDSNGQVSFTVTPAATTTYTVTVAAALPLLAGSGTTTVTVTPAPPVTFPTTVAVTASPATITTLAGSSTLTATVTSNGSPRIGTTATLTAGGLPLGVATTDSNGQVSFTVLPLVTTTYTISVPAGGSALAGSGQATVTVNLLP
jgi:hypothetical protein